MDMNKTELRKFIKENRAQLERFAGAQASGRLTREEQRGYENAYRYINPKASLCFTCGRSAQLMGRSLLKWEEDNQPKKRKK
jgi:hypothetical protein